MAEKLRLGWLRRRERSAKDKSRRKIMARHLEAGSRRSQAVDKPEVEAVGTEEPKSSPVLQGDREAG